jgi:hypothetical protein
MGVVGAYREEIRKLRALPAPALLWTVDDDIAAMRWVILCFRARRRGASTSTWQPDELRLVIDALAQLAPISCGGTVSRSSPKNSPRSRPGWPG